MLDPLVSAQTVSLHTRGSMLDNVPEIATYKQILTMLDAALDKWSAIVTELGHARHPRADELPVAPMQDACQWFDEVEEHLRFSWLENCDKSGILSAGSLDVQSFSDRFLCASCLNPLVNHPTMCTGCQDKFYCDENWCVSSPGVFGASIDT